MPKMAEEKTTIKKRATASSKRVVTKRVARKAPTKQTTTANSSPKTKFIIMVIIGLFAVGGASFAIGTSDKGPIDVSATISQRASVQKEKGNIEESEAINAISTQVKTTELPNGGLVGRGNKETEQQRLEAQATASVIEENASSTDDIASSTNDTASSTEEVEDGTEDDGSETSSEDVPDEAEENVVTE